MKEHQIDIRNVSDKSNIAKHVSECKNSFDFASVKTLAKESSWTRRIIKERLFTNISPENALNDVKFKPNVFS